MPLHLSLPKSLWRLELTMCCLNIPDRSSASNAGGSATPILYVAFKADAENAVCITTPKQTAPSPQNAPRVETMIISLALINAPQSSKGKKS